MKFNKCIHLYCLCTFLFILLLTGVTLANDVITKLKYYALTQICIKWCAKTGGKVQFLDIAQHSTCPTHSQCQLMLPPAFSICYKWWWT